METSQSKVVQSFWEFNGRWENNANNSRISRHSVRPLLDIWSELISAQTWSGESPIQATSSREIGLDDFPFSMPMVMSDQAKHCFERFTAPEDEFIPMMVQYEGKPVDKVYWVLNCLTVVDCIDYAQSPFEQWPNGHRVFAGYVIDTGRVPKSTHCFRVKEELFDLLVSNELKSAIEEAGLTGGVFADTTKLTDNDHHYLPFHTKSGRVKVR